MPESLKTIQKTLEAFEDSSALPRSSAVLIAPMMMKAMYGVLKRGCRRPRSAGSAPSWAAAAATRFTPRLQVTMLATQA